MGSSSQNALFFFFPPAGNDNKHSPTRKTIFLMTAREPLGAPAAPRAQRTLAWLLFLQGLIDRGVGVQPRGAGLHEFGRIMWGHGAQSAGGCSVGDAGHHCHHLGDLLFELLDLLILLQDLPCQTPKHRKSECSLFLQP